MNGVHDLTILGTNPDHQDHAVFFYHQPGQLTQVICDYFLSFAHRPVESFILAGRQNTWEQLRLKLGVKLSSNFLSRIQYIDAEVMARELVDSKGHFQSEVFNQKIAKTIVNYHANKKSLTVYGEIVDVLCSLGFYQAAQDLEKAWHQLIHKYSLNLLCGYNHQHFIQEKNHSDFINACDSHSRIAKSNQMPRSNQGQIDRESVCLEHDKLCHLHQSAAVENRKALAYLGEMQSEVFHEIKNIISISALSANQLRSLEKHVSPEMQPRFARLVSHITESQKRLNNIIVESMDLVRSQKEFWQKIDLNDCLLQAINLCSDQIQKNGIDLSLKIDHRAIEILGVAEMVERIFVNILDNAIHALAEESANTSKVIQITSILQDGKAMISITNNGPTISEECLAKIFTPFYTTKKRNGTGIGLSYSKKIAQSHDGEITCESSPEIGVRFTLILPCCGN